MTTRETTYRLILDNATRDQASALAEFLLEQFPSVSVTVHELVLEEGDIRAAVRVAYTLGGKG